MTRESFLIFVGVLIIVSPFAGLPLVWLSWILPGLGLLVILTSALMRHDRYRQSLQREEV